MYDIIGDIHGQVHKLTALLTKLDYQFTEYGWQHATNQVIFVGDFIDRGPWQLETLNIIKQMVDNRNALAIMGNHELNAVGWFTQHPQIENRYLRPHNERNLQQHHVFLQAVEQHTGLHQQWIDWFKQLPVYLELDGIRVIHACWDNALIQQLSPYLDDQNRFLPSVWPYVFNSDHELFFLTETLLKGKEIELPTGVSYQDKDGIVRWSSRIRWWLKQANTLKQLCMMPPEQLATLPDTSSPVIYQGYNDEQPLFIGHYWLTGKPELLSNNIACVDYSAAIDSGKLVAYRWSGEKNLTNTHFIY